MTEVLRLQTPASLFAFLLVFTLAPLASADVSSTSASAPSTSSEVKSELGHALVNKEYQQDTGVTDTKLQADSGSLSRYSLKFSLTYNGPRVGDPENPVQPNPDGNNSVHDTALTGSVGARYRFDSDHTLSFGTGMSAIRPLHGLQRFDVSNPFVSYDTTRKFYGIQLRSSPGLSYATVPNYTSAGEVGGANWLFSAVKNIGTSRFAATLDSEIDYYIYTRAWVSADKGASQGIVMLYPGAKYNVTDKVNVNSSFALGYWSKRSDQDLTRLTPQTLSQRLGVGWAVTRDVYLAPFLNFYPAELALNTTTINFSTVFSIL